MKDDRLYLTHVLEAIAKIREYAAGGREEFMRSSMVQDSVVRNLEVIGEATKNLAGATRAQRPEILWRRVAGLREVLIHNYMGVDLQEVWRVVEVDLPALQKAVEEMLGV